MKLTLICLTTFLTLCPNSIFAGETVVPNTTKIAHVTGVIDDESAAAFLAEMDATSALPGERVILIDSPGGVVSSGQGMIDAVEAEKAKGVHVTCVVQGLAASMAFNLLSHCDNRIAAKGAILLFHKIEVGPFIMGIRTTARNLRRVADELDKADAVFNDYNAKVLGFTKEEYDFYADRETFWNPSILYKLGYLNGILPGE